MITTNKRILRRLRHWINQSKFLHADAINFDVEPDGSVAFTLTTAQASYHISADENYLGCIASTHDKKGNDLADGPMTKLTWNAILADIVGYEVTLHDDAAA